MYLSTRSSVVTFDLTLTQLSRQIFYSIDTSTFDIRNFATGKEKKFIYFGYAYNLGGWLLEVK